MVILGGATGTVLKGRGSLQDIDQLALFAPHVKWAVSVARVRDLVPAVEQALYRAAEGVPGPVFVECPVDLLYGEETVRSLYGSMGGSGASKSLAARGLAWYLRRHVDGLFRGAAASPGGEPLAVEAMRPTRRQVRSAARRLARAKKPVLMVGSQALLHDVPATELAVAVEGLGVPVYLSGMAAGFWGLDIRCRCAISDARPSARPTSSSWPVCRVTFRLEYGRQGRSRAERR